MKLYFLSPIFIFFITHINTSQETVCLQLQQRINASIENEWVVSQEELNLLQSKIITLQQSDNCKFITTHIDNILSIPICYDRNHKLKKSFSKLYQFCLALLNNNNEIINRFKSNDYLYQQLWPLISYLQCKDDAPIVLNACNLLHENIRLEQLLFYSIAYEFYDTAQTLIQYNLSDPYWVEKFMSLKIYSKNQGCVILPYMRENKQTDATKTQLTSLNMHFKSPAKTLCNHYFQFAQPINISALSLAFIYNNTIFNQLFETINPQFLHEEKYTLYEYFKKINIAQGQTLLQYIEESRLSREQTDSFIQYLINTGYQSQHIIDEVIVSEFHARQHNINALTAD